MTLASWSVAPLGDRNGRVKNDLMKPDVQKVTISEEEADAIRRKLIEHRNRSSAAEEKVASQERLIAQLSSALAKAHSRENRKGGGAGENTMELAAVRLELHQTRQNLESKDSELDRLLPEVVASRMQTSQRLCSKDAEIEQLRKELDSSRAEVAQLRPELHQARQSLEHKEAELDSLLPEVVASRMQGPQRLHSKDSDMDQTRRELESTRAELASKSLELQQAREELELKDGQLQRILTVMDASRAAGVQKTKEAKLDHVGYGLSNSRLTSTPRKADEYLECLRSEPFRNVITPPATKVFDDFEQVHLNMERPPSQKQVGLSHGGNSGAPAPARGDLYARLGLARP